MKTAALTLMNDHRVPVYLASFFIACAFFLKPSPTLRYDFRYIAEEESLTLSYSKSAPPIAAIEDELLPNLPVEPAVELKAQGKRKLLVTGRPAWTKLRRYSVAFNRYSVPLYRANRIAGPSATAIVRKAPEIKSVPKDYKLIVAVPISEVKVAQNIRPAPAPIPPPLRMEPPPPPKTEAKAILAREIFEEPETEEAPLPKVSTVVGKAPSAPREFARVAMAPPPSRAASPPSRSSEQEGYIDELRNRGRQGPTDVDFMTQGANKNKKTSMVPPQPQQKDLYKLSGTVELSGGLAIAGELTKLSILWRNGDVVRKGEVDLHSGEFVIPVPALGKGRVVSTLTNAKGKILGMGEADLEVLGLPATANHDNIRIMLEPLRSQLIGAVYDVHTSHTNLNYVRGAEVFGPAAGRETTDRNGIFRMASVAADSSFILDTYASDSWATRTMGTGHLKLKVPVYSNRFVESFLGIIGQNFGAHDYGIVWGKVTQGGKPLSHVKVGISTPNAMGPIYFNKLRVPDASLTATTDNGLYAFVKVPSGLHIVFSSLNSRELPSTVVSTSPRMVSVGDIRVKKLVAKGRVYDPVERKTIPAQVSVIGHSGSTKSGTQGFAFQIPSSDSNIFFQVKPNDAEYAASRTTVSRTEAKSGFEILSVKRSWLNKALKAARTGQPGSVVLGYVKGPSFHVHAEGMPAGEYVDDNIFYLNENGEVDLEAMDGISGGGAFLITNLKPGPHVIVISSASGEISKSRLVVTEPNIINTMVVDLDD